MSTSILKLKSNTDKLRKRKYNNLQVHVCYFRDSPWLYIASHIVQTIDLKLLKMISTIKQINGNLVPKNFPILKTLPLPLPLG